ncbi:glycine/betaine ABC transporter ATP-binding protein [Philodulcilactobacillus myokoensis]|uniref:Quaternary amine transport ATP-binding protein n=1 Tax=Philodulcilactobacillus myokoensis TaxID=2929573 RepID=A0A9W6ESI6_9LACO|nr:glycine betaine/L-proline ABC transporter ATP-binding protein [Philodulcilactobacillus myokoensis]GLB46522.1 glycine/betaine ABC transporter ATP-binding protein [Philodulcilactobacillus myokoensis]
MADKIQVKNLTKIFGHPSHKLEDLINQGASKNDILKQTGATIGVRKASFNVKNNEIFVIMGLSGSGKSTLIRMLNHLIAPTSGQVYLDGKNITSLSKKELRELRRQKMSMVFQNFALFPNRTILENTAYGLEIQGVAKNKRYQKAKKALQLVGLNNYGNEFPNQLSGGMQQRVGLARALTNDPEILLMDEAFSALDPLNRKEMQDELLDLQESLQKTIVFISHDLNEALRIGDRIMIMKDGEVVQTGTPEEILRNPKNDYVRSFIQGVDRTKVLHAKDVMVKPAIINIEKDGPRIALRRMRDNEISSVYVIDSEHRFKGLVRANDADRLIQNNDNDISKIIEKNVPIVKPNMAIKEIIAKIPKFPVPVAVVDKDQKLIGIIINSSVLEALSGNEGEK